MNHNTLSTDVHYSHQGMGFDFDEPSVTWAGDEGELPVGDDAPLGVEESQAWLDQQQLNDLGGGLRIDSLLKNPDTLPALEATAVTELAAIVARDDSKNNLAIIAARYPSVEMDEALMNRVFSHPAEIQQLVESNNDLVWQMTTELVGHGAGQNQGGAVPSVLEAFDSTEDPEVRSTLLHHMNVLHDERSSDWAKNISYALLRMNVVEAGIGMTDIGVVGHMRSAHQPSDNVIDTLAVPLASALPSVSAEKGVDVGAKLLSAMSDDEKRMVFSDKFLEDHPDLSVVSSASLPDLRPDRQEAVVSNALIAAIEKSHNKDAQERASQRNAAIVESGIYLRSGDLIHTTSVDSVDLILSGGLVAGELIGEGSRSDSYPLNVDFNEVKPGDITERFSSQIDAATVGFHQRGDTARKISYIIPADHEFSDRPADSANENHRHRLAFAAVSATEIGGIVLNDTSDEALKTTKQIVLEAVLGGGVYYPVISGSGELLLTPEEFASRTSPLLDELKRREGEERATTELAGEFAEKDITIPDGGMF